MHPIKPSSMYFHERMQIVTVILSAFLSLYNMNVWSTLLAEYMRHGSCRYRLNNRGEFSCRDLRSALEQPSNAQNIRMLDEIYRNVFLISSNEICVVELSNEVMMDTNCYWFHRNNMIAISVPITVGPVFLCNGGWSGNNIDRPTLY